MFKLEANFAGLPQGAAAQNVDGFVYGGGFGNGRWQCQRKKDEQA